MSTDRPNPLTKVALSVGLIVPTVIALAGAAVTFGVLNAEQATGITTAVQALPDALAGLGTAAVALVGIVAGVAASFTTAKIGARQVTPIESPAIENPARPGELVPLVIDTGNPIDHTAGAGR